MNIKITILTAVFLLATVASPSAGQKPPPIYDWWDDYYGRYSGDGCYSGLVAPQSWYPYPECGAYGGCTYCWQAFPTWYYQDSVLCSTPRVPVEDGPLTFGDFDVAYRWPPSSPTYYARFEAIEGLDCLKDIPLECTKTIRPVVSSARYRIVTGGSASGSEPGTYSGALYFVTAVYDETIFEVEVSGSVFQHPGSSYYWDYEKVSLRSFSTLMFQDQVFEWNPPSLQFRQSAWRVIPDYVQVKLKEGRSLADLRGRSVRLFLHTLRWDGDGNGCPTPYDGDRVNFKRTDTLDVGACPDVTVEDWYVEPPTLSDECAAPNLPETTQKAAEFEAIGVKVVNDLNVDLPSMRVGHNRFKAGRTLAETLANDAYWHAYGSEEAEADFLRVNMFGVWFAVEDVPGWTWGFYEYGGEDYLRVIDDCANLYYDYFTTDTDYTPGTITYEDYFFHDAKLLGVIDHAQGDATQRTYDYQSGDITQDLISQTDSVGNSISYAYVPSGGQLELTVTGDAPSEGTRQVQTTFDPEAVTGEPGTRPLVEAVLSGGGASRVYEWYPIEDPPTQKDRKLKKVSDLAGNVLAEFDYDDQGRFIKQTRGSTGMGNLQTLAEFLYEEPEEPDDDYHMEARFYLDETDYQAAIRTFDKHNQVIELAEYEELSSTNGIPAVTVFDYHIPPEDTQPGEEDPFYHQVCTIGGEQVVLTRCMEKTWPAGDLSEYTLFNCDFNVVEAFMAPPGITEMPAAPKNHMTRTWARNNPSGPDWGVWQITQECDESRDACTDLTYDDDGFLTRRDEPEITVGVNTGFRAYRSFQYDNKHRIDWETRNDGTGVAVTIDLDYDQYNSPTRRTENPGAEQIEWTSIYDAFGQETRRTDPDGYVQKRDYDDAGLLVKTYTYASGDSGPVIKQTNYTYEDGRLKTVEVADHDGPFALDGPAAWVTTTYDYDDYGRLISKTVTPGGYVTPYEYDFQDRLTSITHPDGLSKQTIRNGRGFVTETRMGPDPVLTSTYECDPNGNLTRRLCQGCPDCAHETQYDYDQYNRRTAETQVE